MTIDSLSDTGFETDTSDMIGVHNVFREALSAGPELVATAGAGPGRVAVVGTYLDNVLRLLDVHHEAEDELLTPKLLQRCPAAERQMVATVAGQHGSVLGDLRAALEAIAAWRAGPDDAKAAAVRSVLERLRPALFIHLQDEERLVLPIASRYIGAEEWGALPGHAMRTFNGDKLWLILGLVFEQMTSAQATQAQAHMPPPVSQLWADRGARLFAEFRAQLPR